MAAHADGGIPIPTYSNFIQLGRCGNTIPTYLNWFGKNCLVCFSLKWSNTGQYFINLCDIYVEKYEWIEHFLYVVSFFYSTEKTPYNK